MEPIKPLNNFTRKVLLAGLILLLYGYLCRQVGLNFFWESKSIGWAILFIGAIGFLISRIKIKKTEKKKTLLEKIGIGILIFILLIQTLLIATIPYSDAYPVAKAYLRNDAKLKNELGNITGFGLIPSGSVQKSSDSSGEYGSVIINFIVKGDRKFKDVTIYVVKTPDSPEWKVEGIE